MNKILVVDDEVKACEILKEFLEIKGYQELFQIFNTFYEITDKLKVKA